MKGNTVKESTTRNDRLKRISVIFTGVCLLSASIFFLFNHSLKLSFSSAEPQSSLSDLSFAVVGDVHDNINSLQVAIQDLHQINPRLDALILNGDTVDQGIEQQYESITKTLSQNKAILPKTIIKNIGNHEFFDYINGKNSPVQVSMYIQRYLAFAGEKKVYHDQWLNGYHFISLGSMDGNSETLDSVRAYISPAQRQWFKDTLAKNYQPGKPIFVFLHQHLNSNPKNGWVGTDQAEELVSILSKYPESIVFTSHTHADLTENSVVLQQPFTMVHTGAIHYTFVRPLQNHGASTREPFIKGLYVQVSGNTVIIKGRDFKEKSWIFARTVSTL